MLPGASTPPNMQWTLYTREADGAILSQIDDYNRFELVQRFNGVGTWALGLHGSSSTAPVLARPGTGIYLVHDDTDIILSGWCVSIDRSRDATKNTVTVAGVDDNVWLRRRLAHPQPGTASPPYSATEHDVRTGVCSTVLLGYVGANAGTSAVAARKVTTGGLGGLVLAADPLIGSTVTGRARWTNLLELLQELALAGGDIGFRIRHTGTQLQFEVYQPADKSAEIQFSTELGTLGAYTYSAHVPDATYAYVGGGGEGTARTISELGDNTATAAHGRAEKFVDQRQSTDLAELTQAGTEALIEGEAKVSLELTPVDTEGQTYRTHYDLGDKVTAYVDEEPISELIREVKIDLTPESQRITPVIGTPSRQAFLGLFTRLEQTNRRLSGIERR